ncbi:hypothetical protein Asd1617_05176 [Shigella dysenteriae 1617]|uniref:Uncharacterized protein n=1 Tax=Shigella dysenteriae 1617 TaxID=754093 RepID=A0A0A7A0V8_SHIDY|nr:hypothetical protein Asd1617_05176 [Shigella dysenteriae 1617]
MLILRHLPAIAASVVAGDHADVEWRKQNSIAELFNARLTGLISVSELKNN